MATEFERQNFKTSLDIGGVAMKKMQQIAQTLYDSTPGLIEGKYLDFYI